MGRGIAIELAKRGATVLLTYAKFLKGADQTVADITAAGGKATAVQAEGTDAEVAARSILAKALEQSDGGIDIIVNNAADGTDQTFEETDTVVFDRIMHINVLFPMMLVKVCKPHLRKGARVVNISSTAARVSRFKCLQLFMLS